MRLRKLAQSNGLLLMLLSLLAVSGQVQASTPSEPSGWIYLDVKRDFRQPLRVSRGGTLSRELVRQSILLAMRDELGGITRDAVLEEPTPADSTGGLLITPTIVTEPKHINLQLILGQEEQPWSTLEAKYTANKLGALDFKALLEVVEGWSRQELPEALRAKGMTGQPHAWHPQGAIPDKIEVNLGLPTDIVQYYYVKQLHKDIRTHGESPERLAALVRAYAMLGQSCRYYWNASEKVFYARSLLYAQRLVHKTNGSQWALWHRAYAWAMVGVPAEAIVDLDAAAALTGDRPEPAWKKWIEAYARDRVEDLQIPEDAKGAEVILPLFLQCMLAERTNMRDYIVSTADALLSRYPISLRVIQGRASMRGVGNMHQFSSSVEAMMALYMRALYANEQDMPDKARRQLKIVHDAQWPAPELSSLVRELRRESDAAKQKEEMSWGVLAMLLQEAHLSSALSIGVFQKFEWSIDARLFLSRAVGSVEGHRYAPLLQSLMLDRSHDAKQIDDLIMNVKFVDMNFNMHLLYGKRWWGWTPQAKEFSNELWKMLNTTKENLAPELALDVSRWTTTEKSYYTTRIKYLSQMAPDTAVEAAARIKSQWSEIQDQLPAIEARFGQNPLVLYELIRQYINAKDDEKAIPSLERYNTLLLTLWGSEQLADIYFKRGDEKRWKQILEQYLASGEESGLEKPSLRSRMAYKLMSAWRYEEALPYAKGAAESYAAWGLNVAAYCLEGLGKLDEAHDLMNAAAQRYDHRGDAIDWYLWCQRVGHGNLNEARQKAMTFIQSLDGSSSHDYHYKLAIFFLLEGNQDRALRELQAYAAKQTNPTPGPLVNQLRMALKTNNESLKNQMLARFDGPGKLTFEAQRHQQAAVLLTLFIPALRSGQGTDVDLAAVEKFIAEVGEDAPGYLTLNHMTAEFLHILGRPGDARTYFERCVVPYRKANWDTLVESWWSMRNKGIEPRDVFARKMAEARKKP